MHSGKIFEDFVFTVLEGQICYLAHILCSCTRQYECDNVLDGCWSDTGSEAVPGQNFVSVNFRGPGFIHEYRENFYTAKISTYTVITTWVQPSIENPHALLVWT